MTSLIANNAWTIIIILGIITAVGVWIICKRDNSYREYVACYERIEYLADEGLSDDNIKQRLVTEEYNWKTIVEAFKAYEETRN